MEEIIMPIQDKTGQKFGHLTVIRLSEKRHPKNNKILWECLCDCGNPEIIYVTTGNLTQGYKTSCGCVKKQQLIRIQQNNKKDLTKQTFGKLTVISEVENSSPPKWNCRCECGKTIVVSSRALLRKERTSCGCKRKELRKNLVGKRFGKLLVIRRDDNYIAPSGQELVRYKCKCDCGSEVSILATSLQQGLTQSCGCLRSTGEMVIKQFLLENNINFQTEYKIQECKDKKPLPFDFCIFDNSNNIKFLIEVQGKQHYQPCFHNDPIKGQQALELQQQHDLIKQTYCLKNNIDLLIIPYYELNNFKKIILERLNKYD